jgi:hypothetical protein
VVQDNNNRAMPENPLLGKVWIAFRLVVFGVFGFVVMFFAFVALINRLTSISV